MIVDWLIKVVVVLALIGLILFDAGSIAVNYFGLDSRADEIAIAVSTDMSSGSMTQPQVEATVKAMAKESGAKVVKVKVDPVEHVLHIRLRRTAHTLLVGRIGATEKWSRAVANGRAGTQ